MTTLDLATLRVRLTADANQFKSDMRDARQSADQLGAGVGTLDDKLASSAREMDASAVKAAAYAAKARQLDQTLSKLGAELAQGNITVEQAAEAYDTARAELDRYGAEMGQFNKELKDSGSVTQQSGMRWTELASKVQLAQQAFQVVAGAARVAYENLKAGAELELAEQRWDNLAGSIGETSDAMLTDLRAATSGMVSDAELIASASDIISLGLADTGEGVVDLSALISNLGWDMNQVILTFANDSKMRLDALGLSVVRVEEIMAELEAQGIATDKAFDMAVIQAGQEKLALLGSAAETTAGKLARFEAGVDNLTDTFRRWLVDAALPTIDALTTIFNARNWDATPVDNITESLDDQVDRLQRVNESYDLARTFLGRFTGTADETSKALYDQILSVAATAESYDEFVSALEDAGVGSERLYRIMGQFTTAETAEEFYALAAGLREVESADNALRVAQERHIANQARQREEANRAAIAQAALSGELEASEVDFNALAGVVEDTQTSYAAYVNYVNDAEAAQLAFDESLEMSIAAVRELVGAFQGAASYTDPLIAAQEELAAAQGEWVNVTRNNSGEIGRISEELAADLNKDQVNAYKEILNTVEEGSAEWLAAYQALQGDLSDAERQGLIARMAELEGSQGTLASVYTGDAEAAEEAAARIVEAQEAIQEAYRATAFEGLLASAETMEQFEQALAAGVEIGAITQEQANAQLAFAQAQDAIGELNQALRDGQVDTADYAAAFDLISSGAATSVEDALAQMDALKTGVRGKLEELKGEAFGGAQEAMSGVAEAMAAALSFVPGVEVAETDSAVTDLETQLLEITEQEWMVITGADTLEASGALELLSQDVETLVGTEYQIDMAAEIMDAMNNIAELRGEALTVTAAQYDLVFNVVVNGEIPSATGAATAVPGFAAGGYTGDTGGVVHPNEYVFNEDAVRNVGVPAMDALHAAAQAGTFTNITGGDINAPIMITDSGNPMATANALSVRLARQARRRRAAGMGW